MFKLLTQKRQPFPLKAIWCYSCPLRNIIPPLSHGVAVPPPPLLLAVKQVICHVSGVHATDSDRSTAPRISRQRMKQAAAGGCHQYQQTG